MSKKDVTKVEEKKEEKVEIFASMCGFEFDPSQSSDCYGECRLDNPESYSACLKNYEVKPVVTKKKTKVSSGGRGKNIYGHLIGSQADLIDRALLDADGPLTINDIAKKADAKAPRTRHHVLHLIKDWHVDIRQNATGIFIAEKFPKLTGKGSKEFK